MTASAFLNDYKMVLQANEEDILSLIMMLNHSKMNTNIV